MLKGAPPLSAITNANNLLSLPYAARHDKGGQRWVITGWEPCQGVWGNDRCPCVHSDPRFPDCEPQETVRLRGWLSFYQGNDIRSELRRIDNLPWRTALDDDS